MARSCGAKEHQPATRASAIQVMMIRADGTPLPAECQVSLYENLIDQLRKKSVFQHVYRDGDRNAEVEPDLVALQCTLEKFEKGSEKMRQVTTVAGATSMTLRCEFKDKGGNSLLERDITGKVRFFGGNLKATYDFAKKAANVAAENFLPLQGVARVRHVRDTADRAIRGLLFSSQLTVSIPGSCAFATVVKVTAARSVWTEGLNQHGTMQQLTD